MIVDHGIVPAASADMQEARAIFAFLLIDELGRNVSTAHRSGNRNRHALSCSRVLSSRVPICAE